MHWLTQLTLVTFRSKDITILNKTHKIYHYKQIFLLLSSYSSPK